MSDEIAKARSQMRTLGYTVPGPTEGAEDYEDFRKKFHLTIIHELPWEKK